MTCTNFLKIQPLKNRTFGDNCRWSFYRPDAIPDIQRIISACFEFKTVICKYQKRARAIKYIYIYICGTSVLKSCQGLYGTQVNKHIPVVYTGTVEQLLRPLQAMWKQFLYTQPVNVLVYGLTALCKHGSCITGPAPFSGKRLYAVTKPGFSFLCSIFVFWMNVCFCCVRFSLFITSQETGCKECL